MFLKILIVIIILIALLQINNYYGIFRIENFTNANPNHNTNSNFHQNNLSKSQHDSKLKKNNIGYNNLDKQQITQIDEKILFNNKDYNENLSIDNKDNKYYYDDMIDQSNVNETSFNIVYSIDPIDYANVKTGINKCNEDCKGICFENGYDGIATCYPTQPQTFDWGTLYKNPTFTYGYNAYGQDNLPQ